MENWITIHNITVNPNELSLLTTDGSRLSSVVIQRVVHSFGFAVKFQHLMNKCFSYFQKANYLPRREMMVHMQKHHSPPQRRSIFASHVCVWESARFSSRCRQCSETAGNLIDGSKKRIRWLRFKFQSSHVIENRSKWKIVIELFFWFLLLGPLCLGILGFKSEQYLPRWISRRPSGGLFIFFIRFIKIYFGVFIQLLQDKREKK